MFTKGSDRALLVVDKPCSIMFDPTALTPRLISSHCNLSFSWYNVWHLLVAVQTKVKRTAEQTSERERLTLIPSWLS